MLLNTRCVIPAAENLLGANRSYFVLHQANVLSSWFLLGMRHSLYSHSWASLSFPQVFPLHKLTTPFLPRATTDCTPNKGRGSQARVTLRTLMLKKKSDNKELNADTLLILREIKQYLTYFFLFFWHLIDLNNVWNT